MLSVLGSRAAARRNIAQRFPKTRKGWKREGESEKEEEEEEEEEEEQVESQVQVLARLIGPLRSGCEEGHPDGRHSATRRTAT
ncbi:hypothetical protein E2C01_074368 [Portunus trituberculatus]|uniref:Uncharacterized protein n=1 Tax=Portunus trituberculatus TaxID=210409 RepID=A0A5B7I371_PORTR|nr:hypothetical protein [Portunus trituberculatus]